MVSEELSFIFQDTCSFRAADVLDAEQEFLCDAEQTSPDGHNQQDQTAEHVEGEIQGS